MIGGQQSWKRNSFLDLSIKVHYNIADRVNSCNQIRASMIFPLNTLRTDRVKLPPWKCYKTIGSCVSCAFIQIWKTWEVWRALKKQDLLLAMPRATLTHLLCSPNFPCALHISMNARWRMNQLLNDYDDDDDSDSSLPTELFIQGIYLSLLFPRSTSNSQHINDVCFVTGSHEQHVFFLVTSRAYKRGIVQNYLFSVSSTAIHPSQNTLLKMAIIDKERNAFIK